MPALAEIQLQMRQALVDGDVAPCATLIAGDSAGRFEVHRHNYEGSLTAALEGKFPATGWLVGTAFVDEAARRFIRENPPRQPCIAEYGAEFPAFLAASPAAGRVAYLRDFAELEWRVGNVSIAADQAAVRIEDVDSLPSEAGLKFQSGVFYLKASWPVDELLKLYLTDGAPERLEFSPEPVCLEIRGSRGEFSIQRLTEAHFTFRNALCDGRSIEESAEAALELDDSFDPEGALVELITGGSIMAVCSADEGK